eukprot:s7804_g2.t1
MVPAGFVAGLCLIRARFSWALRDVSSELEHDVLVVNGFTQEGLSKRSRNVSQAATSIGVGSHPPEASRTALHTEPALHSKDGSSTCGMDKTGYSSGCKIVGCTCSVFQHCYPKFEKEEGRHQDVGVCGLAMWLMSLLSALLFGAVVFTLMVTRSCLQYEDKTRRQAQRSWRGRPLPYVPECGVLLLEGHRATCSRRLMADEACSPSSGEG